MGSGVQAEGSELMCFPRGNVTGLVEKLQRELRDRAENAGNNSTGTEQRWSLGFSFPPCVVWRNHCWESCLKISFSSGELDWRRGPKSSETACKILHSNIKIGNYPCSLNPFPPNWIIARYFTIPTFFLLPFSWLIGLFSPSDRAFISDVLTMSCGVFSARCARHKHHHSLGKKIIWKEIFFTLFYPSLQR